MNKYAIIRIKGKQYRVSEGDELLVDRNANIEPEILLYFDGDKPLIGKPLVDKIKLKFTPLEIEVKGEKVTVQKYKSKSRYRKKTGFRPVYSKIKVDKITSS